MFTSSSSMRKSHEESGDLVIGGSGDLKKSVHRVI
jgi:hypothetical protein